MHPTAMLSSSFSLGRPQVILTKDLANVGTAGEMLSVPVGYYRNFLLPRSLAEVASDAILQ